MHNGGKTCVPQPTEAKSISRSRRHPSWLFVTVHHWCGWGGGLVPTRKHPRGREGAGKGHQRVLQRASPLSSKAAVVVDTAVVVDEPFMLRRLWWTAEGVGGPLPLGGDHPPHAPGVSPQSRRHHHSPLHLRGDCTSTNFAHSCSGSTRAFCRSRPNEPLWAGLGVGGTLPTKPPPDTGDRSVVPRRICAPVKHYLQTVSNHPYGISAGG